MEQKLTKEQTRVILILNEAIGQARNNLVQAERDMDAQVELLQKFHNLPEGKAQLRAEDQEIIMFIEEPVTVLPKEKKV